MGVKVVRPTYRDKATGKIRKLDANYVQTCFGGERTLVRVGTRDEAYARRRRSRTPTRMEPIRL